MMVSIICTTRRRTTTAPLRCFVLGLQHQLLQRGLFEMLVLACACSTMCALVCVYCLICAIGCADHYACSACVFVNVDCVARVEAYAFF